MKFISAKERLPVAGQMIVKRWSNGAVWAGRYAGGPKESSFDEWASIEDDEPAEPTKREQNFVDRLYIEKARNQYALGSSDDIEIDEDATVDPVEDGAWVYGRVWVRDDEEIGRAIEALGND